MLAAQPSRARRLRARVIRGAFALILALAGIIIATPPSASAVTGVRLAVVVPIVVPARSTGLIPASALAEYTAPGGILSRQLDAVANRPVTLALDPAIMVSIRVLGNAAPTTATAWLDRLASVSNDTFALAYADADITLATQAGSPTIPAVNNLEFAIASGSAGSQSVAGSAAATPGPGSSEDPSTQSLLNWPYTISSIAWPRENTVASSDLEPITESGYSRALLSTGNLSLDGDAVLASVGSLTAIVVDDAVSAALRTAASGAADAAATAAAAAAVTAGGSRTIVATMDRGSPANSPRLAESLSALAATPGVTLVPLSAVLKEATAAAKLTDEPHEGSVVAAMAAVFVAERADIQFATVANEPHLITGPRRLQVLALLSNQWSASSYSRAAAARSFVSDSEDLRNAISVVRNSGVNLLADRASLPITVQNGLPTAVTVYISVRPETGLLAVTDKRVKLQIEPNSQGKGQIPVQAISNGTVSVTISLTSEAGVAVGTPARSRINVQAGWETPVVVSLAVLVSLVFTAGLVRSIVKRRRERNA